MQALYWWFVEHICIRHLFKQGLRREERVRDSHLVACDEIGDKHLNKWPLNNGKYDEQPWGFGVRDYSEPPMAAWLMNVAIVLRWIDQYRIDDSTLLGQVILPWIFSSLTLAHLVAVPGTNVEFRHASALPSGVSLSLLEMSDPLPETGLYNLYRLILWFITQWIAAPCPGSPKLLDSLRLRVTGCSAESGSSAQIPWWFFMVIQSCTGGFFLHLN